MRVSNLSANESIYIYIYKAICGEGDVTAWLRKIKLVAKLQGIDDLSQWIGVGTIHGNGRGGGGSAKC